MAFTLANYVTSIGKRLVDESQGTVTGAAYIEFLNSGLRRVRRNFDIPSSETILQMPIYQGVQLYSLPSGYKDYVGLYDQFRMNDWFNFKRVDEFDFWRNVQGTSAFDINQDVLTGPNMVSESRDGLNRYLLINLVDAALTNTQVNNCDTLTSNGLWTANTATSDAANIASDTLYVREGSGSIRFDILVAQSVNNYAEVSNSTVISTDLSGASLANVGTMTMWVYLPTAVNYTSFTLRWGSSSSNYYESTVTTNIGGGAFVQGWNQLGFDWALATQVGTPVNSAITFLLFRATYPASFTNQTGLRIDDIQMRQKRFVNLHYLTDFLIIEGGTGTGTVGQPKEAFDSINDTSSYFNCDRSFVDWITYCALEEIFTYYKLNPNKAAFNKNLREELEQDIWRRFPSRRELPTRYYEEQDNLMDQLN